MAATDLPIDQGSTWEAVVYVVASDYYRLDVTGTPTGGTFRIPTPHGPTEALPYTASAAQVQAALEAVLGVGNVDAAHGPLPATPIHIAVGGDLAGVAQGLTVASSLTGWNTPAARLTTVRAGGPFDLTGYTVSALLRRRAADTDPISVQASPTNRPLGEVRLSLADTAQLPLGRAQWELWVTAPDGSRWLAGTGQAPVTRGGGVGPARVVAAFKLGPQGPAGLAAAVRDLVDGPTVALDASTGTVFRVTLAGNRELASPTNPIDGQRITLEVRQDIVGGRTLALPASFRFPTGITYSLSATPGATDHLRVAYRASTASWHVETLTKGY